MKKMPYGLAVALIAGCILAPVPLASAKPPVPTSSKVACGVLDQLQESLDDDINIDGLRAGLTAHIGWARFVATNDALNGINHGLQYMEDIDRRAAVPGLAPLLSRLRSAVDTMNQAVNSLRMSLGTGYYPSYGYGWYGGETSQATFADPGPGTWGAVDYVGDQRDAISALVGKLRADGCV